MSKKHYDSRNMFSFLVTQNGVFTFFSERPFTVLYQVQQNVNHVYCSVMATTLLPASSHKGTLIPLPFLFFYRSLLPYAHCTFTHTHNHKILVYRIPFWTLIPYSNDSPLPYLNTLRSLDDALLLERARLLQESSHFVPSLLSRAVHFPISQRRFIPREAPPLEWFISVSLSGQRAERAWEMKRRPYPKAPVPPG